ncbi:MAG: DUF3379 family protein, partial [Pseudomonadota bacterium]
MDELAFRRTLYADPHTKDIDVVMQARQDPKKLAFWDELKTLDNDIALALRVDVPENLAQKLLLRQSINIESKERARKPWYWAMAATVALAAV